MIRLLIFLTTLLFVFPAPASGAAAGKDPSDRISTTAPKELKDLFFGEALYDAFQGHWFDAIARLDTELAAVPQGRRAPARHPLHPRRPGGVCRRGFRAGLPDASARRARHHGGHRGQRRGARAQRGPLTAWRGSTSRKTSRKMPWHAVERIHGTVPDRSRRPGLSAGANPHGQRPHSPRRRPFWTGSGAPRAWKGLPPTTSASPCCERAKSRRGARTSTAPGSSTATIRPPWRSRTRRTWSSATNC